MNVRKILKAIFTTIITIMTILVFSYYIFKAFSTLFSILFILVGNEIAVITVTCIIGFIILVKAFYELDDSN